MKQQHITFIQLWGGRAVAVIGYLAIFGFAAGGLGLMGLALLLAFFTRADGAAAAAMLSGAVIASCAGLALVWQLRRTQQDLRALLDQSRQAAAEAPVVP